MNYPDFFSQLRILLDPDHEKLDFKSISQLDFKNFPSKIIVSLVHFEEDKNRRNQVSIKRNNDESVLKQPVQTQVFYLLFSSHSQNSNDYISGIQALSEINHFFHSHPIIKISDEKKCLAEWVSLNWEQQFYLWKSLGVKQLPYFLYKFSEI